MFCKGVLRNFAKIARKHHTRDSFLIKLQAACNFIKKRLSHRCFPEEFCKISKNTFLTEHLRCLLLKGKTLKSSRSQMFFKIAVLKNFAITVKKTPALNVLLIKFQAHRPAFLLKKRLQYRFFLRNF